MPCHHVKIPGGGAAIVCVRTKKKQRCSVKDCVRPGTQLCDWKVPERKSGTCDALVCVFHTHNPAGHPHKDLCPKHKAEWERMQAEKAGV